jgi:hypothetical protein
MMALRVRELADSLERLREILRAGCVVEMPGSHSLALRVERSPLDFHGLPIAPFAHEDAPNVLQASDRRGILIAERPPSYLVCLLDQPASVFV